MNEQTQSTTEKNRLLKSKKKGTVVPLAKYAIDPLEIQSSN
jgi:hypothetical protein